MKYSTSSLQYLANLFVNGSGIGEIPRAIQNLIHMGREPDGIVTTCCTAIISFFIATGLTALFIWVGLRGFEPICTLQQLQIPAIANSTTNSTLYFTLLLHNRNKDTGIYYDPLNLSFSYPNLNRSSGIAVVGNTDLAGFYQGGGKNVESNGSFICGLNQWRKAATESAVANGTAKFRVDLKTEIRYKIVLWKTKRHRLNVGADVSVDREGNLVVKKGFLKKKGVQLTSAAQPLSEKDMCFLLTPLLASVVVSFLILC